jgi:homoserine O-succinyltransferase
VFLKLFAIPEMPRADAMRRELAERYRDISELWDTPLDGLIVTGTEPRAKNLKDEPYWETLSKVVDWAKDHTASTIWSCLAAHAAVLHADGIERRALKEKRFGVFDCRLTAEHPMTEHFPDPLWVPHSRYNDLPDRALTSCGYKILTRSAVAGVDTFAKQDGSFFLFFQGHPEYDADTLLREYRRDAARFLAGERDKYPAMPLHYFNDEAAVLADAFAARARAEQDNALIGEFPNAALEAGLDNPWRQSALGIYQKWTAYLRARKAERRPLGMPLRRTWRDWPLPLRQASEGSPR